MTHWIVMCRSGNGPTLGEHVVATHRLFTDKAVAEKYAATVHPSREPEVMTDVYYLLWHQGFRLCRTYPEKKPRGRPMGPRGKALRALVREASNGQSSRQ